MPAPRLANMSTSSEPLLPVDKAAERPLWIVLITMAFIAALALLSARLGDRHYGSLQADLSGTATVQLTELSADTRLETAQRALDLITQSQTGLTARRVSDTDALSLIQPWMGDSLNGTLPDGISLPVLITLTDSTETQRSELRKTLASNNITAIIDDHSQWSGEISRAARAYGIGAWLILLITFFAGTAASIFATQSAMAAQAKTVSVFAQVGAPDNFIMRIFVMRAVKVGATSALIGGVLALLFLGLFRLLRGPGQTGAFADMSPAGADIIMLIALGLVFTMVSAAAAGASSKHILNMTRLYQ